MVQRVSLRSQDFILVHADKLCVCRDYNAISLCCELLLRLPMSVVGSIKLRRYIFHVEV
jgi:hypothetical protein